MTDLYCNACLSRVDIEAEAYHIRYCPFCGSNDVAVYEPTPNYQDLLFSRVVDPLYSDPDYNYIEKIQVLEGLVSTLRDMIFYRKYGPLMKVLREIENGQ